MPRVRIHRKRAAPLLAALMLTGLVSACGDSDESTDASTAAPKASDFPGPDGRSIDELMADYPVDDNLVIAPSQLVYTTDSDRFGFGVFTVDHSQVTDAEVALYAAPPGDGPARGPYPAAVESLATDPGFTAQTTSQDPDAAKDVYIADVDLDQPGEWRVLALVRGDEGEFASATLAGPVVVRRDDPIPDVGDRAPVIHTPTVDDVGNVERIDTRIPPDTMHDVDFADVVGEQPIVLVMATPALCQTRVCGPVVDIAEQVKNERPDDAAYIHMEIWNDNDIQKGARPQVLAYHLRTEPWLFVIDANGRISTRIEGAFSPAELNQALDRVAG
jgi:hypothetical protein